MAIKFKKIQEFDSRGLEERLTDRERERGEGIEGGNIHTPTKRNTKAEKGHWSNGIDQFVTHQRPRFRTRSFQSVRRRYVAVSEGDIRGLTSLYLFCSTTFLNLCYEGERKGRKRGEELAKRRREKRGEENRREEKGIRETRKKRGRRECREKRDGERIEER